MNNCVCGFCGSRFKFGNAATDDVIPILSSSSICMRTKCPKCREDIGYIESINNFDINELPADMKSKLLNSGVFDYEHNDPYEKPVTVGKLIKILQRFPQDLPVINYTDIEIVQSVSYCPKEKAVSIILDANN